MTQPAPASSAPRLLRIASRESALALWQARFVQARLRELYPSCEVEILGMTTTGDQVQDRTLASVGGKGLFTKELEVALLDGRADLAVHSLKDVPMELPAGLELSAMLEREDPRDAFVSNHFAGIEALPAGARVGTASLRRAAQIQAAFPALELIPLRGNVNTRLAKLDDQQYDAIVLAAAGLKRLGLAQRIRQILPPSLSLPAAGQGSLAIETRSDRPELRGWMAALAHPPTTLACMAERTVSRMLGGNCRAPLAAYAESRGGQLHLQALAANLDGSTQLRAELRVAASSEADAVALGERVAADLIRQGALALLATLPAG